jgi:hypothetical protein
MLYITTDIKYEIDRNALICVVLYIYIYVYVSCSVSYSRKNIERAMVIITHTQEGNIACLSCAVYWFEGKYIFSILFYSILMVKSSSN